ncbi:hypothetical protein [Planococcus soli]|uniref:hypothetical protein n=1 Tax=Planococcus soli TaxID=2666072 RepID=UPI00115EB3C1|nr:hypothetical protein [Planococcus soli]
MKKIIGVGLAFLLLAACNSDVSTLSFSKIETVPEGLSAVIDSSETLQLIEESDNTVYLVYQAEGEIATGVEEQENSLKINLDTTSIENGEKQEHVYKMTLDDSHEAINVYINGEYTSFVSILTLNDESGI